MRGDSKARIRSELYRSASRLPGDLEKGCNEVRLLHGTKPDLVWSIVQQGLNERLAGASAGTAFGDGSYFADDAGKIDQYVVEDKRYNAAKALHQQLYSVRSVGYVRRKALSLSLSVTHTYTHTHTHTPWRAHTHTGLRVIFR